MKSLLFIVSVFILISFYSCKKDNEFGDPNITSTTDSVYIDDVAIGLTASVWRDFSSSTDRYRDSLRSEIILWAEQGKTMPSNVNILKQYLFQDGKHWEAEYDYVFEAGDRKIVGVSYGGPLWEINTAVDVVCEFEVNGKKYTLIHKNEMIYHVDF